MSEPPPPPQARRSLPRATNLLKPSGRPVNQELDFDPSQNLRNPSRRASIRRSIKKTISEVKELPFLSRSKSTLAHSAANKGPGVSRSQSVSTRPTLFHSNSTPPSSSYNKRYSTPTIQRPSMSTPNPLNPPARSETEDFVVVQSPVANAQSFPNDVSVPQLLRDGTPMTKVSNSKRKTCVFHIDADQGQIVYESKRTKIVPIESIKELRFGSDARYDREQLEISRDKEDHWISIIYILDGDYKSLHLIAPNQDTFHMWQVTLQQLYNIRRELMTGMGNQEMRQALWEKHYWKGADLEQDEKLDYSEVEKLCHRLNVNAGTDDLKRLFKQADVSSRGYLNFEDFQRFVKVLKGRPELDRLYKKLKGTGEFTFQIFEEFMFKTQKSMSSREQLQILFDRYGSPSPPTTKSAPTSTAAAPASAWSLDTFTQFLMSTDNATSLDTNRGVWHDMTRPLSEYYISSSHNTYLVGHQLVGESTVEGYVRALLHSCRSVEIDIYDGDREPMIFHGKTLTSKVSLREVCEAIKKYGFISSPYPVIISAEIHCGLTQQDMIADIMMSVFGDILVQAPIEARPAITILPSPEDLKGRILLKAKNLLIIRDQAAEPVVAVPADSTTTSSDTDLTQELSDLNTKAKNIFRKVRGKSKTRTPQVTTPSATPNTPRFPEGGSGHAPPKMSLGIVALLVYTVGVKCRGINKKETYAPEHMFSLSENAINKMIKSGMFDLIKHARTHLVRTYPKGLRLSSTNYYPHRFWSAGAQLVALNLQTFDKGFMINHAMFQRNGHCGYVLKPGPLRIPEKELLTSPVKSYLDISIISAQQLPRPRDSSGREIVNKSIVDPYVEVTLHVPDWSHSGVHNPLTSGMGVCAATTATYKTSIVKNNGFNPVWEETLRLPFSCVGDMKDLIFVEFAVRQEDVDEPLALFCSSLGSLQLGYRHLPLHDAQMSQFLFASLFVKIDLSK